MRSQAKPVGRRADLHRYPEPRLDLVVWGKTKELQMSPNVEDEPSLTPSADSHSEKAEKIRAGKGVVGILGGIAGLFLIAFVVIIIGGVLLSLDII